MNAPVSRIIPGHVFTVGTILVKSCTRCGVTRELERFTSKQARPGGVDDLCTECRRRQSSKA